MTKETEAPERVFITWPNPNSTGLAFSVQARPPAKRTEYIRADLARTVQVKPLEWEDNEAKWCGQNAYYAENDLLIACVIDRTPHGNGFQYDLTAVPNGSARYETLDEAKAAAQSDYERRTLSALEPAPQPQITVAQAAQVLLEAGNLPDFAVNAAHQQIDWSRDDQKTHRPNDPSQTRSGGTSCATDVQDAWREALRALAQEGE